MNKFFKSTLTLLVFSAVAFAFTSCNDDDVIGLNSAAKYGKITVTLSGKRPDGETFTSKKEFKFMPEEGPESSEVEEAEGGYYFSVQRMHGATNNDHNNNQASLGLFSIDGQAQNGYFYVSTSVINTKDNTFFYVNESLEFTTDDITQYSYNKNTGKLRVKFEGVINDSYSTGNDLKLVVDIDVKVFEGLNSGWQDR